MPTNLRFDRYYTYDEITRLLHEFARERPDLVEVHSLGRSHQGREIWLATVTRLATGPADEKPAFWVDANIHATELSPSSAALHLLHTLTTGDGSDADITRALDTRAFYSRAARQPGRRGACPGDAAALAALVRPPLPV